MSKLLFYVYSEDDEVRARISRSLTSSGKVELVSAPCREEQLEEILATAELDGIYVDLGERSDTLLTLLEAAPEPRPALLLGGSHTASDVLLRAMRLQPRDFCVENELRNLPALLEQIERASQRPRKRQERHGIIATAGAKGGVGTTMTACELASSLQQLGDRVVVLDLNLYHGDAAMHFDLKPPYTIADVAKKGEALDQTFLATAIATHIGGVRVLAAPAEVQDIAMVGASHVERALNLLRAEFDWIIIDLPHAWDDVSLRALDLADQIVLVTNLDVPALTHTRHQLDLLERFGAPEEQIHVVINRHNRSSPFSAKELDEFLGRDPDVLIPQDDLVAQRCVNEGKLLREVGRGSKLERAFMALADSVCKWTTGEAAQRNERQGWLARARGYLTGS
jgi:pilus assembly protein CpaE